MNIGMLGESWHTGDPQNEGAVYERVSWQGSETIMVGAIVTPRGLLIPSCAARTKDELRIYGIIEGRAEILIAHRGGAEPFATALSVVW